MSQNRLKPPDPHIYAVGAQLVAALTESLRGLYVNITATDVLVQGLPDLPTDQQLEALRGFAGRLGAQVTIGQPITTRMWSENYTYTPYEFRTEYDGVTVHGFVHVRDVGRTDEVRNGPARVLGGAA